MTSIEIRDLEMATELDGKDMAKVTGGCPGGGMGQPVYTVGYPYVTLANPYDPSTLYGRMPTIPSWMWGLLTPAQ